jgi:hypothetical protein
MLPTTVFAIHLTRNQAAGWLVGEFSLEEMWRMVDRIRLGEHGAPGRRANGEPSPTAIPTKTLVARTPNMQDHPWFAAPPRPVTPVSDEYEDGRRAGVATGSPLGWTVIVEQPPRHTPPSPGQLVVAIRGLLA